jgi:tRNA/rRNA methyltransferase
MSAGGSFVLEEAEVFTTLQEALADLEVVYATSGNKRDTHKVTMQPSQVDWPTPNLGVLFGCERSGLNNEELALCDGIINIQTAAVNPSLNLAQAVAIMAYEYSKCNPRVCREMSRAEPVINKGQITSMLNFLETELESRGFFSSPSKKGAMMLNITDMLVQSQLLEPQASALFGIFRALSRRPSGDDA